MKKSLGQRPYQNPLGYAVACFFLLLVLILIAQDKLKTGRKNDGQHLTTAPGGPHLSKIVLRRAKCTITIDLHWVTIDWKGAEKPTEKELEPELKEVEKRTNQWFEPPYEWKRSGSVAPVADKEVWRLRLKR